jgi:16S rRNA (uracil1498-N3)-methyltransferase
MHLFYTPDISGTEYTLSEEESKHAIRVLRLEAGETVQLVDGKGGLYEAKVTDPNPKRCKLEIIKTIQEFGKKPYHIHIAVAPTKNLDRMEWFIEKAVEIGIDEISFLKCARSERKELKLDRLEKIAVSAMKQSLKAYLPKLNELMPYKTFLANLDTDSRAYIAHLEKGTRQDLKQIETTGNNFCVLIGPEGDFTPEEIEMALAKGIKPVTLGESRLRTETAALVACHTLNLLLS